MNIDGEEEGRRRSKEKKKSTQRNRRKWYVNKRSNYRKTGRENRKAGKSKPKET